MEAWLISLLLRNHHTQNNGLAGIRIFEPEQTFVFRNQMELFQ